MDLFVLLLIIVLLACIAATLWDRHVEKNSVIVSDKIIPVDVIALKVGNLTKDGGEFIREAIIGIQVRSEEGRVYSFSLVPNGYSDIAQGLTNKEGIIQCRVGDATYIRVVRRKWKSGRQKEWEYVQLAGRGYGRHIEDEEYYNLKM